MRSSFSIIIIGAFALVALSGCAVYANPHHGGVYVAPRPIVVSPVVVSPGWGHPRHPHHGRRW